MWYKIVNRQDLVGMIEQDAISEVVPSEFQSLREIPTYLNQPTAIWKEDPRIGSPVPTCIIIPSEETRDFLAWVSTYISLRPFSAYCRVIEASTLQYLDTFGEKPPSELENCCLGLIFSEISKTTTDEDDLRRLSPSTCGSTLSFALARAVMVGFRGLALDWIQQEWKKAKTTAAKQLSLQDAPTISRLFSLALNLSAFGLVGDQSDRLILECARDVMQVGKIREYNWAVLVKSQPDLMKAIDFPKLPREGRIQLLRSCVKALSGTTDSKVKFAIGYLGAAVAPGTFDHRRTMKEIDRQMSDVVYWYGFCCGLFRKNSLQAFSGGVGRRVVRDFERADSIFDRPYCDIGIRELEMLSSIDRKNDVPVGNPGIMEIELSPCVTTVVPLSQQSIVRREELADLAKEFDFRLQDLGKLRNKLFHSLGLNEPTVVTSTGKTKKRFRDF